MDISQLPDFSKLKFQVCRGSFNLFVYILTTVTVIMDSGVGHIMELVDVVLVGAEAIVGVLA